MGMVVFKLLTGLAILGAVCEAYRMRYLVMERPEVTWYNPKYVRNVSMTSRRYSRDDPFYYVGLHAENLWPVHNNVSVDLYFYEFLSNQYKLSFPQLHFELCDIITKDILFGISFKPFFPHPCPLEPGIYHLENLTMPLRNVPENFPYPKGRVKFNFTSRDTHESLGYIRVDAEIKEINIRRVKNRHRRNL